MHTGATTASLRVLVTGAAGFIGAHVAAALQAAGHEVLGVDNFTPYYDPKLKRDRVAAVCPEVTILEGDVGDVNFLTELFAAQTFDVVCHLAASPGVRYSIEEPVRVIENNLTATATLLETMRQHSVPRMVFASSSSVYGNDTAAPFTEAASATAPASVYGMSKRAGELLVHTYHSLYGLEATCLRFFTVYGPWSRPDMAMLKFAQAIRAGQPIDVYNHGDLRRDFTYIDDIVTGFVASVTQPLGYRILNLGRGEPVALRQLIRLLEDALGQSALKNELPMQLGDVYETYADPTAAAHALGVTAQVPIETGVARFTAWFNEYYG